MKKEVSGKVIFYIVYSFFRGGLCHGGKVIISCRYMQPWQKEIIANVENLIL